MIKNLIFDFGKVLVDYDFEAFMLVIQKLVHMQDGHYTKV